MYSANPIGTSLLSGEQRCNPFQGSGGLRSLNILLEAGSALRRSPAFGEQQSLHVGSILKNTCAFQRLASSRPMGHGSRLFQRRQRLDLQILLGPSLVLFPVHSKKLGAESSSVCSVPNVGTELAVDLAPGDCRREPNPALAASNSGGVQMSKEKPTDDPRQQTDWGSHKQTDKPWKGNPEKEQRSGSSKPDLEKWHETNTH